MTDKTILAQLYIGNKITALERYTTLKTLSEHFSFTYIPAATPPIFPQSITAVLAKTLTEMPLIFHGSKINLNTTSKPIRTGIPLRVFDIMGCGGFVLSNYQPELCEFFEPGVHFDYYTSQDEL